MTRWLLASLLSLGLIATAFNSAVRADEPGRDAAPTLKPLLLTPLPLGAIKPSGWLERQLKIQAQGQSGHLDEYWPDIRDSSWIGGKAEGWERVPYWLDGMVPLAYLTDDPALKAKVQKFIDYILDHQQSDGWLGPIGDTQNHKPYDVWPLFPLFKALTQYQEVTGDPRVIPALLKCAKKIDEVISKEPVYSWAQVRVADLAVPLYWLYDRTKEAWVLDLARKAFAQSHDWTKTYDPMHYPYTGKTTSGHGLIQHGVNTGMAIKYGPVRSRLTDDVQDRTAAEIMLMVLDRYHGQATGIFTCDEHLAGREPFQGTELCTVVETMYSLEQAIAINRGPGLADRLERLAYNAQPGTYKPDMTAHQYDQQANQVICKVTHDKVYTSNSDDSNTYGLEPNFGCCTANQHQGWPKFTSHLWMKAGDGALAAVAYAPCVVTTKVNGVDVRVEVKTDYPFRDTVTISFKPAREVSFGVMLRIPSWAKHARVSQSGQPDREPDSTLALLTISGANETVVTLKMPMPVTLRTGLHDSISIERGPLVYSLKVGAEWRKLRDRGPFADWEVIPTTPWNYALEMDRDHPEQSISFEEKPVGDVPFSPEGAPVIAHAKGRLVPQWKIEHGAAGPVPDSPVETSEPVQDLTLVPYGCTSLRVTEFPTTK